VLNRPRGPKTPLSQLCQALAAIVTFCHRRRRASQTLSYLQEICGGKCKIFSYRQEIPQEFY